MGYPNEAPYDRIIVTASAPVIPKPLIDQLSINGRMVIPVGDEIFIIEKTSQGVQKKSIGNYVFVPLIGEYGYNPRF